MLLFFFLVNDVAAQLQKSRTERLRLFSEEYGRKAQAELEEATRLARLYGWPLNGLYRVDKYGEPKYKSPENFTAAVVTTTFTTRLFFDVTGSGMTIGLWEAAARARENNTQFTSTPLLSHQDFGGRITVKDGSSTAPWLSSSHATHVAGTLIGETPPILWDPNPDSRGMAYQASLDHYSATNDVQEMGNAAAVNIDGVKNGQLLLSNHSYGDNSGWDQDSSVAGITYWTWRGGTNTYQVNGKDVRFGQYDSQSKAWDNLTFLAPYYLPVKSAGNDHSDNPLPFLDSVRVWNSNTQTFSPYTLYNPILQHPWGDGIFGFTTTETEANSKNILTVGAVDGDLNITNFSGRGPTNDGRIKPDICGYGQSVYSADNANTGDYSNKSGTSMSTPNVAGSLLLLQQLYRDKSKVGNDSLFMKSATLKALALHTATDVGNPGPDYTYGWGVLNTFSAATVISADAWSLDNPTSTIIEASLNSSDPTQSFQYAIKASGTEELKVTMVYTDSAKVVNPDGDFALVNDLDLFVYRPSIFVGHEPYVLDPNNPENNATTGDNDRDNVEQVLIASPANDLYIIDVSIENVLVNGAPQDFSLIISGLDPSCYANIQHKLIKVPTGTYTASHNISSQGTIEPGQEVTYRTNGRVVLKPGFRAAKQFITGAGFFKTTAGSCN